MEGTDGYICMGKSHTIVSMSTCSGPVQQVPSLVSSNRSPEVFVLVTNSKWSLHFTHTTKYIFSIIIRNIIIILQAAREINQFPYPYYTDLIRSYMVIFREIFAYRIYTVQYSIKTYPYLQLNIVRLYTYSL